MFEINVYLRVSGDSETVAYFHAAQPAAIVQMVLAAAFLFVTLVYRFNQGIAPAVAVGHAGVALQFQTHQADEHFGRPVEDLIYAEQPFWLDLPLEHNSVDNSTSVPKLLEKYKALMETNRVAKDFEIEANLNNRSSKQNDGSKTCQEQLQSAWNGASKYATCVVSLAKLLFRSIISSFFFSPLQLWSILVLSEKSLCVAVGL